MITPTNVILVILIFGTILSVILERKRKETVKSLLNSANEAVSIANMVDRRLQTKFQESLSFIDNTQLRHRINLGSLTQIAETVIYTKRRVKTYYDHEKEMSFSFEDPPIFLASGIEIDPGEFRRLLKSKTKKSFSEEVEETALQEPYHEKVTLLRPKV